jgi:hypothetical protein
MADRSDDAMCVRARVCVHAAREIDADLFSELNACTAVQIDSDRK